MKENIIHCLRQKGHEITKIGKDKDIFIPRDTLNNKNLCESFKDILYKFMSDETFRREFRNYAYGKEATQKVEKYLTICDGFNLPEINKQFFSDTFEWYVSEILRKEFGASASGFSICLKDAPDDEFDCLAKLDDGLFYAECKTGKIDVKKVIRKFVSRDSEVTATYSILIFDRDYIFDRKDDSPKINIEEARNAGIIDVYDVSFESIKLIRVNAIHNRYFLIIGGMKKLEEKIRYGIKYFCKTKDYILFPKGFRNSRIPFTDEALYNPETRLLRNPLHPNNLKPTRNHTGFKFHKPSKPQTNP